LMNDNLESLMSSSIFSSQPSISPSSGAIYLNGCFDELRTSSSSHLFYAFQSLATCRKVKTLWSDLLSFQERKVSEQLN
jgi:hypothetical protein